MDWSILFILFTLGISQPTIGGQVCMDVTTSELVCPQGEVLIASRQDNLSMVMAKYPCLYQHLGRNKAWLYKSSDHCTAGGSNDLPDNIEMLANYFQCAPKVNMSYNCPPRLPGATSNIVNGPSCGLIISCYTNSLNYDLCDQDNSRCTIYLHNYGHGMGNTLYAYVYYLNGTNSYLQYEHGVSGSLSLGHRMEYPQDRRFTLRIDSRDINLNFTIAYEVFSPGDEMPDINSWDPGECWKRKGVVNPHSIMCPATYPPTTTTTSTTAQGVLHNERSTTEREGGNKSTQSRRKDIWIIVGAVVGGFIILVLIIACCCCHKRWTLEFHIKRRSSSETHSTSNTMPTMNNTQESAAYSRPACSPSTQATDVNVEDNDYAEIYEASSRQAVNNGNSGRQPNTQNTYQGLIW